MNKTGIEWCDMTWNPVTGCRHECEYCYARRIAARFGTQLPDGSGYPEAHDGTHRLEQKVKGNPYPYLFEPTFTCSSQRTRNGIATSHLSGSSRRSQISGMAPPPARICPFSTGTRQTTS